MNKELKGLVFEIVAIILLLIIVVPICVNASNEYLSKIQAVSVGNKASVDISNKGEYKQIKITTNADEVVKVGLIMKIKKFNDEYIVHLDDQTYNLNDLEYTEDDEYQYYHLGVFDVEKEKMLQFKIQVKDKSYYDETITYSFYTEGLM